MEKNSTTYIRATVTLPVDMLFEGSAIHLEKILKGFHFRDTDRYDEVPAFVAQEADVTFTLFGIPEGETSDVYILKLSAETPLTLSEFKKTIPEFISKIFTDKEMNSRGYFDYSEELANALCSAGMKGCEA